MDAFDNHSTGKATTGTSSVGTMMGDGLEREGPVLYGMDGAMRSDHQNNHNHQEASREMIMMNDETLSDSNTSNPNSPRRRQQRRRRNGAKTASRIVVERITHGSCLRSRYSLRTQLLLSFGFLAIVAMLCIMVASIVATQQAAGTTLHDTSEDRLEAWGDDKMREISRIVGEIIDAKGKQVYGFTTLLNQIFQERLRGYPHFDDNNSDDQTPFLDYFTQNYSYPLQAKSLLPLNVDIVGNILMDTLPNETTADFQKRRIQHVRQHRIDWYNDTLNFTTATAVVMGQGFCHPRIDAGCIPSIHNNISSGGSVQPTTIFAQLHERISDFATPVFKSIYEYYTDTKSVAVGLVNDGAGMMVVYPGFVNNATAKDTYTSIGCEWMAGPNPLDPSRPMGTPEQIARCHPKGTQVPTSEFNPLERGWCQRAASSPNLIRGFGPYPDAFSGDYHMTFGQGIYDSITKDFIGCSGLDISVPQLTNVLSDIRFLPNSTVAIVGMQAGDALASYPPVERKTTATALNVSDVSVDFETFLAMKEDFRQWYHVRKQTQNFTIGVFRSQGRFASYYVTPPPVHPYNKFYQPSWMVITTIQEEVPFHSLNEINEEVDTTVSHIVRLVSIFGVAGLVVVLVVVYVVSLYLTMPLEYMHRVGEEIVASAGSSQQHKESVMLDMNSVPWTSLYAPRTEITMLIRQFQRLTKRFAGSGTAKLYKRQLLEVKNPFLLNNNLAKLYQQRKDPKFLYDYTRGGGTVFPRDQKGPDEEEEEDHRPMISFRATGEERLHYGPNIHSMDEGGSIGKSLSSMRYEQIDDANDNRILWRSPLFRWILGTLATPLMLTIFIVAVYSVWQLANLLPSLVTKVETSYLQLERGYLNPLTLMRARHVSELISIATRDLYLLTRFFSWLYFGAIDIRNNNTNFVSMVTAAEQCKNYPASFCPVIQDTPVTLCDCKWNDPFTRTCRNYNDSRPLQQAFFSGLSQDVFLPDGVRNRSSPGVGLQPNETAFYASLDDLPGAASRFNSTSRFQTTFDRVRTASAAAVIQMPLYNYRQGGLVRLHKLWASFLGLEAGGMFLGYTGCTYGHANHAHFRSTESNGAGRLNPDLCPLGKYGYDPRCRDWYVVGKEVGLGSGDPLYVTPPYLFAAGHQIGVSATLPVVNNKTGEYIGQSLIDFSPDEIYDVLTLNRTPLPVNGFFVLKTTRRDINGGDVVVGPGYEFGDPTAVEDLLLPHDTCTSESDSSQQCLNRKRFLNISKAMDTGQNDTTVLTRTTSDGRTETVNFEYAPVRVSSYRFLDPSDLSAGIDAFDSFVYSLAIGVSEEGLVLTFAPTKSALSRTVNIAIILLSLVIVVLFGCIFYVSFIVTASAVTPIAKLYLFIRDINREEWELDDELPEIQRGSTEVQHVRETFGKLFMLVRFGTTAFYAGDLDQAHTTFQEALSLFSRLANEKAMGIANNDLGNIMLTMYRVMKTIGVPTIYGMTKRTIIENGCGCFQRSIDSGEDALAKINEEEGWSTNYLVFMQQLSNRYFNRAMFLLTVRDDHPNPQEAESQGFMDLSTCKDMDREVVDNGDQEGFKGEMDDYFELLLGRIRGILTLVKLGYEDEWGLDELLADARKALVEALRTPHHALFRNMEPAGQMQKLDFCLIEYYSLPATANPELAAQIAIRMLVEDEYVIGEAATAALKAVADGVQSWTADDLGGEDTSDLKSKLFQYKYGVVETMSLQFSKKDGLRRASYHACNSGDLAMEVF